MSFKNWLINVCKNNSYLLIVLVEWRDCDSKFILPRKIKLRKEFNFKISIKIGLIDKIGMIN